MPPRYRALSGKAVIALYDGDRVMTVLDELECIQLCEVIIQAMKDKLESNKQLAEQLRSGQSQLPTTNTP